MEILDSHFQRLPNGKKMFVVGIGLGHFIVAIYAYAVGFTSIPESFLIAALGLTYSELLKLNYRIEDLEGQNKGNSKKKSQTRSKKNRR
jgi:hypothetical protein